MINWSIFVQYDFWVDLGISLGILLIFLVFRKLFSRYVFRLLIRASDKVPGTFLSHIFRSFEKPIQWMFILIGVYIAANYFPYFNESSELFSQIMSSLIIVMITWGLYNMSASSSVTFERIKGRYNLEIDDIFIPFLSKAIRFIIIALSISMIADKFDYNVAGFVAGLGLGGVAIAFAAKESLSHLLGGFVIITEKPFTIGDWILTPDVEGTVEEISFRSTKIRTFDQALITMPNAMIANSPITNWSKMEKRQISFNLRLPEDTSKKKLEQTINEIKESIANHQGVHPETIFVKFDQFQENGYEIFIYFFTKTTVWGEFLSVKEEINLSIMEILEQEDLSIAIPSTKVYVDGDMDHKSSTVSSSGMTSSSES